MYAPLRRLPCDHFLHVSSTYPFYETEYGNYPKIQIITIKELFEGKRPSIPLIDPTYFKKAQAEDMSVQGKLI